jgi:hypothetical protein
MSEAGELQAQTALTKRGQEWSEKVDLFLDSFLIKFASLNRVKTKRTNGVHSISTHIRRILSIGCERVRRMRATKSIFECFVNF